MNSRSYVYLNKNIKLTSAKYDVFIHMNSWTKCLCLITISKQIDFKRFAWQHFVYA